MSEQLQTEERERIKGRIANFIFNSELLGKLPHLSEQEEMFLINCLTNIVCDELASKVEV